MHPCHVVFFSRVMSCLRCYIDFDTFPFIHTILTYSCICFCVHIIVSVMSCFSYFFVSISIRVAVSCPILPGLYGYHNTNREKQMVIIIELP